MMKILAISILVCRICFGSTTDYAEGTDVYATFSGMSEWYKAIDGKPDSGLSTVFEHQLTAIAPHNGKFLRIEMNKSTKIQTIWILKGNVTTKHNIWIGDDSNVMKNNVLCQSLVIPDGVIDCVGTGRYLYFSM